MLRAASGDDGVAKANASVTGLAHRGGDRNGARHPVVGGGAAARGVVAHARHEHDEPQVKNLIR